MSEVRGTIHVLHVVPTLNCGGLELAMARVIRGLPHMRHSVICLKGDNEIGGQLDPSVPVTYLHAGNNQPTLPWRLRTLLKKIRPDVIHARNWSAWPDVAVARLRLRPRIPLVFSFHGFQSAEAMPWRHRAAFRTLAKITDEMFTVSEETRGRLVKQAGLPEGRIGIIPNGVDTERFTPEESLPNRQELVIGTVGSLSPVKNQALLILAAGELVEQGLNVMVRIAGEGPMEPTLSALAQSLGIASRVEMVGKVSDVPQFLRDLDIFVLPSRSEAHPNALMEAMACGLPCIACGVGGVPEAIEQGRTGLLVPSEDRTALVESLTHLAHRPDRRREMGLRAREEVCRRYSLAGMIQQYEAMYRRLAEERVSKPGVVMLGPVPPPIGGMATVVSNLRESLLAQRYRLVVLKNGKDRSPSALVRLARQFSLAWQIAGSIQRHRARIVHIHTCSGTIFWRDCLHLLLARLMGRQVIWHIHGARFDEFVEAAGPVGRRLFRLAMEHASAVLVLSRDWLERLRTYAPRANWLIVPNGIPVPGQANSAAGSRPCFLFMGDLGERKGCRDLIHATHLAMGKGFDGVVYLAGAETEPGQEAQVSQEIADRSAQTHIRLLGPVSGAAKEGALNSADCFVLPSYAEGLPMALLEAMAHGLPSITTRVGGIPDVVRDGQEGFLVEPGDVESLADRIVRLAEDALLRRRMGQAGRQRIGDGFSLDVMVDRLDEVYQALLERNQT